MSISSILCDAVSVFTEIMYFLIFIRCILSWFPMARGNVLVQLIYNLTEPLLAPIREIINRSPIGGGMMLDFSPIIAFFVLQIINVVLQSIFMLLPL